MSNADMPMDLTLILRPDLVSKVSNGLSQGLTGGGDHWPAPLPNYKSSVGLASAYLNNHVSEITSAHVYFPLLYANMGLKVRDILVRLVTYGLCSLNSKASSI